MKNNPDHSFSGHHTFRKLVEQEYLELERTISECLRTLPNRESLIKQPIAGENDKEENVLNTYMYASPFLLKHALFISAYSFMEYSLRKFCEIAAFQTKIHQRRVSEFEKVYQFYFYLIDDLKLDKTKVNGLWDRLNIYKDLRNCMIHYNSSIGKNISSKSYQFMEQDPRIEFLESGTFYIKGDQIIWDLIFDSKTFLLQLIDDYNEKYYLTKHS